MILGGQLAGLRLTYARRRRLMSGTCPDRASRQDIVRPIVAPCAWDRLRTATRAAGVNSATTLVVAIAGEVLRRAKFVCEVRLSCCTCSVCSEAHAVWPAGVTLVLALVLLVTDGSFPLVTLIFPGSV